MRTFLFFTLVWGRHFDKVGFEAKWISYHIKHLLSPITNANIDNKCRIGYLDGYWFD
jgi:hypothetical protein